MEKRIRVKKKLARNTKRNRNTLVMKGFISHVTFHA